MVAAASRSGLNTFGASRYPILANSKAILTPTTSVVVDYNQDLKSHLESSNHVQLRNVFITSNYKDYCRALCHNDFELFDKVFTCNVPEIFGYVSNSPGYRDFEIFSGSIISAIRTSNLQKVLNLKNFAHLFFTHIERLEIESVAEITKLDPFIEGSDGVNLMHYAVARNRPDVVNLISNNIDYLLFADKNDNFAFEYMNNNNDALLYPIFNLFITGSFENIYDVKASSASSASASSSTNISAKVFERFVLVLKRWNRHDFLLRLIAHIKASVTTSESLGLVFFIYVNMADYESVAQLLSTYPGIHFNGSNILHLAIKYSDTNLFAIARASTSADIKYLHLKNKSGRIPSQYFSSKMDHILPHILQRLYIENTSEYTDINSFTFTGKFEELIEIALNYSNLTLIYNLFLLSHAKREVPVYSNYFSCLFTKCVENRLYEMLKFALKLDPLVKSTHQQTIFHLAIKSKDSNLASLIPSDVSYLTIEDSNGKSFFDYLSNPEEFECVFNRAVHEFDNEFGHLVQNPAFYMHLKHFPVLKQFLVPKQKNISHLITADKLALFLKTVSSLLNASLLFNECLHLQNLLVHIKYFLGGQKSLEYIFMQCIEKEMYDLLEFILKLDHFVSFQGKTILHFAVLKNSVKLASLAPKSAVYLTKIDNQKQLALHYLKTDLEFDQLCHQMLQRLFLEFSLPQFGKLDSKIITLYMTLLRKWDRVELFEDFLRIFKANSAEFKQIFYQCVTEKDVKPLFINAIMKIDPIVSISDKTILDYAIKYNSTELFNVIPKEASYALFSIHLQKSLIINIDSYYRAFIKHYSDVNELFDHPTIITCLSRHIYDIDQEDLVISFLTVVNNFDIMHNTHFLVDIIICVPESKKLLFNRLIKDINYEAVIMAAQGTATFKYDTSLLASLKGFHKDLLANHIQFKNLSEISSKWKPNEGEPVYRNINRTGTGARTKRTLAPFNLGDYLRIKLKSSPASEPHNIIILKRRNSDEFYVAKTFEKEKEKKFFVNELEILESLDDSSHFIKLISKHEDTLKDYRILLLEYLQYPSYDYVKDVNARELQSVSAQLFLGLEHLHWLGVVHGDLKPENVMITADGKVKLIDFGLSYFLANEPKYGQGSLKTIAPEVVWLCPGQPDEAVDWWAFGSTVGIWYGINVNFKDDDDSIDAKKSFVPLLYNTRDRTYSVGEVPKKFPPTLRSFLRIFFQPNPIARRLNTRRLLNKIRAEPFFDGIDWSSLEGGVLPVEDQV